MKVLGAQRWEHVHMLLDKVTVENPSDRLDLKNLLQELRKVRELVMGNSAPLKPSIGIKCRFCGLGTHNRVGQAQTGRYGALQAFQPNTTVPGVSWMDLLSCNSCGHVEFFDARRTGSWWKQ